MVTTYGYDDRDRVLSVVHRNSSNAVLASVTYVRSPSGEPTRITREDGSFVELTYDAALRVETETYRNAAATVLDAIEYEYDADGNRTSKTSLSGGFESYAYEDGFQLASITTTSGTETYGYDGGGRQVTATRGGVARVLEYNSDDKLTRVVDGGSEVVEYAYDGAGRRVSMDDGAGVRRYLVAPNVGDGFETAQAVTDASGNVLTRYVFAGEHPIARVGASGQVEYYLQDAMGSVIGMASAAGSSVASIKYDSFGQVTSATGASASIDSTIGADFRYHGMQLDAPSGLYHVRARTYDARTGRFTSRDPIAGCRMAPESMNPYTFNHHNAHVWRDPSGRFSMMEISVTSFVVGVLAGIALPSFSGYLRKARVTKAVSLIAAGGANEKIGHQLLYEELGGMDPGQPLPAYLTGAVIAGAGAGSSSSVARLLPRAGLITAGGASAGAGGAALGSGTAIANVVLPLIAGVVVGQVISEVFRRTDDDVEEDGCDDEWASAIAYCEEQQKNWRNWPQGVTGGYTGIMDCARGLVSERCGGNPTGNPRPDLPLN